MATVFFTSSDSFIERDHKAAERAEVEITDYIEATYDMLRSGPGGAYIAVFCDGAWELDDGRRFSDWAVRV